MANRSEILVEACVDSVESALVAESGGVGRIELCANLVEGGTTPSQGSIEMAVERLSVPCSVMIRVRGGDFLYSDDEVNIMLRDIVAAKHTGASGIVFGCLTPVGTIDVDMLSRIVEHARPMSVTFHRAFDVARDPFEALHTLAAVGVDRLLTSGQKPCVVDSLEVVEKLVRNAAESLVVMPGGGITADNVSHVVEATGAREVHVYTERYMDSQMKFRNRDVHMGRSYEPDEYVRTGADVDAFARVVSVLGPSSKSS